MASIEKLFEKRVEQFKTNTAKIMESMSGTIDGVIEYLKLKEELAQGQLTWEGVQKDHDIVMLTGIIKYPPGAQFATSEGEIMVVSEKTADYFTRILRMRLPIDLVDKNSKDDTMTFLHDLEKEAEQEMEYVEIPSELGAQDFNLDDLTEEQKRALLVPSDDKAVH